MTDDTPTDDDSIDVKASGDLGDDLEETLEAYEQETDAIERARMALDRIEEEVDEEDDVPLVMGVVGVIHDPEQDGVWPVNHHAVGEPFDDLNAAEVMGAVEAYNGELVDNAFDVGLRDVLADEGGGGLDIGKMLAQMGDAPMGP